ncbi:MAG TPA: thioredoxin domain-containing protein [Verrucomicrobiae bacterium]|nr:thioredoxin domain-containing protein [Verrucomicrobiae bacterium]
MKNSFFRIVPILVLPFALLMPLSAQKNKSNAAQAAPQEPGITREQADQILEELRQIRQLLEKQQGKQAGPPEPARAQINIEGMDMLGSKSAPITVVEFTDYQCPFCQRFHTQTFADLKKQFIDTGKVRFLSRDLPLDSIHPNAMRAAMAAHCASDQGQFWALRDLMGKHPDKLDMDSIVTEAASLHLNTDSFRSCVEGGKYKEAVQTSVMEALKFGIQGTPSFVIGKSTPEGVTGEVMEGALPLTEFMKVFAKIDQAK